MVLSFNLTSNPILPYYYIIQENFKEVKEPQGGETRN
jgi:hypothetical protein